MDEMVWRKHVIEDRKKDSLFVGFFDLLNTFNIKNKNA